MRKFQRGFTLVELISVVVLVSIISVTLFSRLGSINTANVQASRDDLIAASFYAQQTAMARPNIRLVITSSAISVTENNTPLNGYPLNFANGVSATAQTFVYDRLGRTSAASITLTGNGTAATVVMESSGYAH